MTRYLVVTTCNAEQWQQYGRAMVRTFLRHWPKEVDFRLYPEGFAYNGGDLYAAAPWLVEFKKKHFKPNFDRHNYRQDAVRWAHKVAAIGAAAEECNHDIMIWMDADIITFDDVTIDWLDSLFPCGVVAWLDRTHSYPECSFLMFRMPMAKKLIKAVVEHYHNGSVFHLPEMHDSYVFQHTVNELLSRQEITVYSLSGEARSCTGHPFVNSRLGEKMDHLKGDRRKEAGKSLQSDLVKPRKEDYWKWG